MSHLQQIGTTFRPNYLAQGMRRGTQQTGHYGHAFVRCDLYHLGLCCSGPPCVGAKRRMTMKPSKQIPVRLRINVLIVIVGLGVVALGLVTTTARILGTSVQEYARLIPF